jgi:hypothetical protein
MDNGGKQRKELAKRLFTSKHSNVAELYVNKGRGVKETTYKTKTNGRPKRDG